ncbi:hypothetical protein PCANC_28737 [Puccinia coronata f. sp. avenae]|uniref:Uncharacterized protein n=1 Tax=Puccinia coronata f. sp. avenae TaxID=200324 RepID=A0A2N5RTZ3_9BASI|nr:hypothetical protein PCANC_28737 [Puccinia coronata f. sp. avenae]
MAAWRCCIAGYPTDATLVRCCLDEVKPDAKAPRLNISPTQHCIDRHRWNGRLEIALRRFWIGSCETASVWLNARLALVDTKPALLNANPLLVDATSAFVDLILSIVDANLVQAPDAILVRAPNAISSPYITTCSAWRFLFTASSCPALSCQPSRSANKFTNILNSGLNSAGLRSDSTSAAAASDKQMPDLTPIQLPNLLSIIIANTPVQATKDGKEPKLIVQSVSSSLELVVQSGRFLSAAQHEWSRSA